MFLADKGVVYERIKSSILKIRNHRQIGPTVRWIYLFKKAYGDEELTYELSDFLDYHGADYKL